MFFNYLNAQIVIDFITYFVIGISLFLLVLWKKKHHIKYTSDFIDGPQKIHIGRIPRIGGGVIFLVLILKSLSFINDTSFFKYKDIFIFLIITNTPCFILGILEDITKKVSAMFRLLGTLSSGIIGYIISGYLIQELKIPILDDLLSIFVIALIFQSLFIATFCNSLNIIDGLNGLVGFLILVGLFSFMVLSMFIGDEVLFELTIILFVVVATFVIFNWPFGKIFLGDGGAYFLGGSVGWLCIILTVRHPEIPIFYTLNLFFYPLCELVFTTIRRMIKFKNPMKPDDFHLHSLIYKLIHKKFYGLALFTNKKNYILFTNSFSTFTILLINMLIITLNLIYFSEIIENNLSFYICVIQFAMFIILTLSINFLNKYIENKPSHEK